MRRLIHWLGVVAVVAVVVIATIVLAAYYFLSQVPDFYEQALAQQGIEQDRAGDEFEKQVLDLHNDVHEDHVWRAVFTDEQVNGWLATDLIEKFPRILPYGVSDPRVVINKDKIRLACRYIGHSLNSVVSVDLEVYVTDEPNVVAIQILRVRSGALPLPVSQVLSAISTAARRARVKLSWAQDGTPVALVTVPTERPELDRLMLLDSIELREGEVELIGRTQATPDRAVVGGSDREHRVLIGQTEEAGVGPK